MGGTSRITDTTPWTAPAGSGGDPNAGGGEGGGAGGSSGGCPRELETPLTGTDRTDLFEPNMLLDVVLDQTGPFKRVVAFDPVSQKIVGSVAGVPGLAKVIECLEAGVAYRANVVAVDGGRVDIHILRQD